ncbi:glycosyltransferase family 39 protein [Candidatus Gottesmanbacteria bacterium]|nr:glycosyltransferase family 39 protein [Candidatus Gottesmanbacteria bacterium]
MSGSILKSYKLLILVSLLAAFLVFFRIGSQSLWLDEGLTLNIARNWDHMWYILGHSEPYMWTYMVLLHYWMKLGVSEGYLRGLSALFAIGTIPFMYALGRKLFGSSVGIMAALLLSINTFFVRYAQEIRAYSLLVLFSTILSYLYILMLENPTRTRRVGYIAIASLSIYTHQFAVFVILSHLISLFFIKNITKTLGFIFPLLTGIGLFCFPLLFIRVPLLSETSWIDLPKLSDIYNFTITLAGGNQLLLLVESLTIVSGFVYFLKKRNKAHSLQSWPYIFTVSLLFIPIILVILVSYAYRPIFVPRYLIISVVPFILLTSYGVVSMGRMSRFIILIVILIGSAAALLGWYGYYSSENAVNPILQVKDDWRGATNYVLSHASRTDAVFFYPYYIRVPFDYYADRYSKSNTALSLPSVLELASDQYTVDGMMPEPNGSLIRAVAGRSPQVWLVLSRNKSVRLKRKQQTEQIQSMLEKYYLVGERIAFTNIEVLKYIRL